VSASVARQVAVRGAAILVLALIVVGIGTAIVLHTRAVDALDQALLAAALGRAHPDVGAEVEVEHVRSPIRAWLVEGGDPRVPPEAVRRAVAHEGPLFIDRDDERLVLLPFEVEHAAGDSHGVAAAAGPRVTLGQSVGPFAAIYSLVAGIAAGLAVFVQMLAVRRAFRPIEHARAEVARVLSLGEGLRLTETGPVEIRSLLEAVNALLGRLEAAHQAQVRFTAEAAHELRTPVTTLLGELDVTLRAPRAPAEYQATLASMREEVARLRGLVDGLTALARIDAGRIDQGRERIRAGELANAALEREARGLAAAGCTTRIEVEEDPELEGHRALLESALANLLRNAARHAPGTDVTMRVTRHGELAVFEVDDGGAGVPAAEREVLFDRFARGGDARRRDRAGLGLGLPIAREVARRHGGDCVLDASPRGGLRARLTLRIIA